jgi:hypothetical protein
MIFCQHNFRCVSPGIRKGLDEFKQGEGIPADQALANLKNKFNIPPRS